MSDSYEPRLIIFSGAGLDAASGVPTFRDADGLWEGYDIMEVCTMGTFEKNYEAVHRFYNQRRLDMVGIKPNKAHEFIAEMQAKYGASRVINFTANVTNLLEDAGVQNVRHIHGHLHKLCVDYRTEDHDEVDIGLTEYDYEKDRIDSRTFEINTKPGVIFFGELAPMYEEMDYILRDLRPNDTFIMVGSTLEVNPVHMYACGSEAYSIIINPSYDETGSSPLDVAGSVVDNALPLSAEDGFECLRGRIEDRMGVPATKPTKEERMAMGSARLNKLIDEATPGDVVCHIAGTSALDHRDDVRFEPATYAGSLPVEDRIPMHKVIKK